MKFHKVIKGLGSTIVNLLILGYIASWIFDIEIWILSELSLIQFILICIAISIISKGIGKMFESDQSYSHEQDKWDRWTNNYDNKHYDQGEDYYKRYNAGNYAPPPPPPPNGSFSDYNPYEQAQSNEEANGFKEQAHQYKEQAKEYKEQAQQYKEQAKEYKEYAKDYKEQAKHYKEQGHHYNDHANHYNSEQQYYENYSSGYNYKKLHHNTFIGDFKFKESYTQLPPMEINAFIGDAHIDLTRVEIPYGETKIQMSCFIGDMKVHVPNDPRIGVKLTISAFIGDGKLFDEKRGGFGVGTSIETPHYNECERKVVVVLNAFIGDVKIKRVG